jgi:hypothetical protein
MKDAFVIKSASGNLNGKIQTDPKPDNEVRINFSFILPRLLFVLFHCYRGCFVGKK